MTRWITGTGLLAWLRREARAMVQLSPWLLAGLALTCLLWRAQNWSSAATAGLFQSEQMSPAATPTLPAVTAVPTSGLSVTPEPASSSTPATEPVLPTAALPTEPISSTLESTNTAVPTEAPPTLLPGATLAASPTAASGLPEATTEPPRYPAEEADLRYDWGMLFDSLALGVSYLWLACGVVVLLGVLAIVLTLWVTNRQRQDKP